MTLRTWTLAPLLAVGGCFIGDGGTTPGGAKPEDPVARNASEAWPDKPDVPPLTRDEIVAGCTSWVLCADASLPAAVLGDIGKCVGETTWSGERAIPMSNLTFNTMERAEFFLRCAKDNQGDCTAVHDCLTDRSNTQLFCQEDGCTAGVDFEVQCSGTVATLTGGGQTVKRDCARAFADCDPESPTGCTDRHPTKCATDIPRSDRCDGDVRLGCDGTDHVSYHDCALMGGKCGTVDPTHQGCVYPDQDPECAKIRLVQCDAAGTLSACVNGTVTEVPSSPACAQPG